MARLFGQRRLNEDAPLYVRAPGIKVGSKVFEIGELFPWHKLEGVTPRLVRLLFEQRKLSHERVGVDRPQGAEGGTSMRERARMQREKEARQARDDAERAAAERDKEAERDAKRRAAELERQRRADELATRAAIAQGAAGDAVPRLPVPPGLTPVEVAKSAQRAGGRDGGRRG